MNLKASYAKTKVPTENPASIFNSAADVDFADGAHSLWPKVKTAFSRNDSKKEVTVPTAAKGDDDLMSTAAPRG